jgi:predicted transcriptional regulator
MSGLHGFFLLAKNCRPSPRSRRNAALLTTSTTNDRPAARGFGGFAVVLRHLPFSRTLKDMEVHFTPEQEAQLAKVATIAGTDPERLVKDAALRVVEDVQFRAAVREGIAQADRGEFIEEEEMDARFEEMLRS